MLRAVSRASFVFLTVLVVAGASSAPAEAPRQNSVRSPAQIARLTDAERALSAGDSVAALGILDQALREDTSDGAAWMLLGLTYFGLQRAAESSAALQRAVELLGDATPAGQDALAALGASLTREEKNKEAIEALSRLAALSPSRRGVHEDLGQIHLALGRLEPAAQEFQKEIALHDPADPPRLSQSGLGIAAYRMGNDEAALAALMKAGDTLDALFHTGLALARLGRDAEAAEAFRAALKIDPGHRGSLQSLARVAAALGLNEERQTCLDRFQQLYQEEERTRAAKIRVKDLRAEASRRADAGDWASAVASLEEASRLAPDDADLRLDLGRLYQKSGDLGRSKQSFKNIIGSQPLRAEAHYHLGRVLADEMDLAGAVDSLEKAVRFEPTSTLYRVQLAQLYMRTQRVEDAVRELRHGRRLHPDDPDSSFNLGLGLAQAGSLAEAAAELEEAIRLGFESPKVHQVLSQVYRGLGDLERAAREQEAFEKLAGAKQP